MLMLCSLLAFSQSRVVTGKVTDKEGKEVPFASVKVKGSPNGVSADANGQYSIRVKSTDVLVISGSGFKAEEVAVENQTALLTILDKGAITDIKEVVVVGALNRKVNAKSVGYAATTIGNDDITKVKAVNVQQGLQGKVAGLNVQSVNSGVLGDTRITLRGIRSLTGGNQPLLVIDGIPVALDLINAISPNDVQEVTVLKSNSAAILYGQEGANGAILITTKKGTKNKPTITVSTTAQFDRISYLPKLQNDFGPGETEDANGLPVYDYFTNNSFGPRYDGSMVPLGHPLANGQQFMVPYTNIPNERYNFFNTGVTLQNDISISGGDKDSRFLFSVQDAKITGIIPNDKNRRTSFRLNSSRDFNKLSVGFNMNYVLQKSNTVLQNSNNIFTNGRGQFDDIYTSVIKTAGMVPLTSLKNWQSNPYADADGYYNFFGYNPYMLIDIDRSIATTHRVIGSVDLNYKINPVFSLTYRLGTTISILNQQDRLGAINVSAFTATYKPAPWGQSTKAAVRDLAQTQTRISSEFFINFKKNFKKFSVDGLVGNSILSRDTRRTRITGNNLVIPTLYNASNRTGEPTVLGDINQIRTISAIAQATLGYDNKVFVTLSGRNDWDSRLNPDNNSFFYPGVNTSVVVSELIPSIKGKVLSSLKLKGSYAKSGSAAALNAYQLTNGFSSGNFPYGNLPGYSIDDQLRDPNIKPEFVATKEVGFELAMFRNRMRLDVNVYQQDNTDQVVAVSLPSSTGYTTSNVNAASFINKGVEVELGLTDLIKIGKLGFDLKTNYTYQENEVTSIYPGLDQITIDANNPQVVARVGLPAFVFNLIDYNRDPQGRVIVDANTGTPSLAGPRKIFGNSLPKHIFGVSPTLNYGNISLSALFEYRGGNFIYNDIGQDLVFNGIAASTVKYGRQPFVWPNSVTQSGNTFTPNTNIYTRSGNANLYTNSIFNAVESAYYTSADFWKLREVALTYSFPQSILDKQKLFKAISASFIARNVALWVPKSNEYTDPEFSNTTGNAVGVTTTGQTPPTRSLGVTFNFTF
jgi:TonB-linked SusC/RagA family outer membrane protein